MKEKESEREKLKEKESEREMEINKQSIATYTAMNLLYRSVQWLKEPAYTCICMYIKTHSRQHTIHPTYLYVYTS